MKFKILPKLLFLSVLVTPTFAQIAPNNPFASSLPDNNGVKMCFADEMAHEMFNTDPAFRNAILNPQSVNRSGAVMTPFADGVTRIPVVVHVIHNNGPEDISLSQIESQIRILNETFRKIPGTSGFGAGVDTQYEFFLAQKDELGNCTDGVVRIASTLTVHSPANSAQLKALSQWDPTRYLNIWTVESMTGGVLGYAQFPGGTPATDGVVVIHNGFGDIGTVLGPSLPDYDQGRITVHEVGHWLGLFHTFQGGCAAPGDQVADTPPVAGPNFPCTPNNSCPGDGPDMIENYMDYSIDFCKNRLTAGQKTRMDGQTTSFRPTLQDSMNAVNAGLYGCLGITYCQSEATNITGTEIRNVSIKNLNNSTNNDCVGYSDFTTTFTELTKDSTYTLSVTTGHCSNGTAPNHEVKAYIDWNRNADFTDPGEEYLVKALGVSGTGTISITVPSSAPFDRTGMRVIATDGGVIGPCNTYPFGETEDYAIQVVAPPPTITSFSPASGPIGQQVFVVGENFNATTDVKFNNTSALTFNVISNDTIQVYVPNGATTGNITVTTTQGSDVSAGIFTITIPAPNIVSFTPTSGPIGTAITIQGQFLTNASQVSINGTLMNSFNIPFNTQITTTIPNGATSGTISVVTPGGTATSTQSFTITVPQPTANISGSGSYCEGISAGSISFNLFGTAPFDVVYTDGTSNFTLTGISANHNETVTPAVGMTTYTIVSITDQNFTVSAPNAGITGSASITVFGNPSAAQFSSNTSTICAGDTAIVTFNVTGGASPYTVNATGGLGQLTGLNNNFNLILFPNATSTYAITSMFDKNGCTTTNFTGSATVTVDPVPNASFTKVSNLNNSIVQYTDQSTGAVSWAWDFGDGNSSTVQNPVHVYNSIGVFNTKLTVTNSANCTDLFSENVVILNVSGLHSLSTSESLNLYPNPVNDKLNIELALDNASSVTASILSTDGKLIKSLNSEMNINHSMSLDLEELPIGMYLIKIELSDKRTLNSKIFKN